MSRPGSPRAAPRPSRMGRLTRLRAFKWPTVAYEVQKNLRARRRGRRRDLRATVGHGDGPGDPGARVAYSRGAFRSLLELGGLEPAAVSGLDVLEVGPGGDLSVALRFLAAGAASVTCVDRFHFPVDAAWQRELHRLLLEELGPPEREELRSVVGPDGDVRTDGSRLHVLPGVAVEEAADRLAGRSFDLVVSLAVLEHVYDLTASLRALDRLLRPGGLMVHQADLRDHGMFSNGGRHPLEFLTLGDRLYRLMTSHTGAPNRERAGVYRAALGDLGHHPVVLVTNVGGARTDLVPYRETLVPDRDLDAELLASIERLRRRLPPRFASLPAEELATTGIAIRSRKPVVPASGPAREPSAPPPR